MNGKARLVACLMVAMAMMFGIFVLLAGCQKEKPVVATQAAQTAAKEATPPLAAQVAQTAEQTICPVMGGAVDKSVFVEYQGKKVYFCCPGCVDTFKAHPEKYVSKLPQFAM